MMRPILLRAIRLYQRWGGGDRLRVACNFTPSCSEYMAQALERHGVGRGLKLGIARLGRCRDRDAIDREHDPVPE